MAADEALPPGSEEATLLDDHPVRGASLPPVLGWFFGAFCLAMAVVPFLTWPEPGTPGPQGPPGPILIVIAIVFGLVGLWLVAGQARGAWRRWRAGRHPEPWRGDHPWSPSGCRDRGLARPLRRVGVAGLVGLALVPVAWFVHARVRPPWHLAAYGAIALAALACLAHVVVGGFRVVRSAVRGPFELRFARFPFEPGSTVEVDLVPPPGLDGPGPSTCTLRCLEERRVEGEGLRPHVLWAWSRDVVLEPGSPQPLVVDLPDDAPQTVLALAEPVYWELTVAPDDPDGGASRFLPVPWLGPEAVRARLLVPVYPPGEQPA